MPGSPQASPLSQLRVWLREVLILADLLSLALTLSASFQVSTHWLSDYSLLPGPSGLRTAPSTCTGTPLSGPTAPSPLRWQGSACLKSGHLASLLAPSPQPPAPGPPVATHPSMRGVACMIFFASSWNLSAVQTATRGQSHQLAHMAVPRALLPRRTGPPVLCTEDELRWKTVQRPLFW